MPPAEQTPKPKKFSLAIDGRVIIFLLLAVIASMLVVWRPWSSPAVEGQSITVSGESTVTAEPDEFVFAPTYQFTNANKDTALAELVKKSDDIVAELKKLGVQDSQIKTNSTGNKVYPYTRNSTGSTTYTFQPTLTLTSKDLAQKVQDYLVSTSPMGSVSPQANFSDAKRKELESKARDEATKEARGKADQSAKNLGFKLGKVKSVTDGAGFGEIYPTMSDGASSLELSAPDTKRQLAVQPGENKLNYSVTVIYYVK